MKVISIGGVVVWISLIKKQIPSLSYKKWDQLDQRVIHLFLLQ